VVNMNECPVAFLYAFSYDQSDNQELKRDYCKKSNLIFWVGINVHQEAAGGDGRNYVVILSGLRGVDEPRGVLGEASSLGRMRTR